MAKIKVIIADDHAVFRSGLAFLLNSQDDIEVIGEASDGEEAMQACALYNPDVLLLDLTMPGMGGLTALAKIHEIYPKVKILVLTMHDDESYIKNVLQSGGTGYIVKKAAHTEVLEAIRHVYRNEFYIHPTLTKYLVQGLINPNSNEITSEEHQSNLTEREEEILKLIALGYTNKQIAKELFISVKTVEANKARLKEKLNLQGRSELVRFAISKGLLPAGDE